MWQAGRPSGGPVSAGAAGTCEEAVSSASHMLHAAADGLSAEQCYSAEWSCTVYHVRTGAAGITLSTKTDLTVYCGRKFLFTWNPLNVSFLEISFVYCIVHVTLLSAKCPGFVLHS